MIEWCLCDTAAATASWVSVDFDEFLERTAYTGDWFRRDSNRAGGKRQLARCSQKTLDKFAIVSMASTGACAFFAVSMHAFRQVFWAPHMCRCVRWTGVVTSANTFAYTLASGCAYALMYVQFVHLALVNEGRGVQLVYEDTCCFAWGVIFDRRTDRVVVCVFSIFNAGGSVCGCMCVCTNTHTTHMGYSVVSPGVGIRHLEGLKNPDGLNLGICVSYMWSKYTCVCICYKAGCDLGLTAFFFNTSFLPGKTSKRCGRKTSDNLISIIDLSA